MFISLTIKGITLEEEEDQDGDDETKDRPSVAF